MYSYSLFNAFSSLCMYDTGSNTVTPRPGSSASSSTRSVGKSYKTMCNACDSVHAIVSLNCTFSDSDDSDFTATCVGIVV